MDSATTNYKPSFTYSDGKLVVDTISMGAGNSYVSGNVRIESLTVADSGTVVSEAVPRPNSRITVRKIRLSARVESLRIRLERPSRLERRLSIT